MPILTSFLISLFVANSGAAQTEVDRQETTPVIEQTQPAQTEPKETVCQLKLVTEDRRQNLSAGINAAGETDIKGTFRLEVAAKGRNRMQETNQRSFTASAGKTAEFRKYSFATDAKVTAYLKITDNAGKLICEERL